MAAVFLYSAAHILNVKSQSLYATTRIALFFLFKKKKVYSFAVVYSDFPHLFIQIRKSNDKNDLKKIKIPRWKVHQTLLSESERRAWERKVYLKQLLSIRIPPAAL